jgi:predicted transcriptional regulator
MKTKKMLKRLNKVDGLLSDVIDGLLTSQDSLERLLGAAKANVAEVVSQLENG